MNYPADTAIIKLSRPFTVNGQSVTELTMREPTVRDRLILGKGSGNTAEKELALLAGLCGLNPAELYTLPGYDYDQ